MRIDIFSFKHFTYIGFWTVGRITRSFISYSEFYFIPIHISILKGETSTAVVVSVLVSLSLAPFLSSSAAASVKRRP